MVRAYEVVGLCALAYWCIASPLLSLVSLRSSNAPSEALVLRQSSSSWTSEAAFDHVAFGSKLCLAWSCISPQRVERQSGS
jgi:hypothetical protein